MDKLPLYLVQVISVPAYLENVGVFFHELGCFLPYCAWTWKGCLPLDTLRSGVHRLQSPCLVGKNNTSEMCVEFSTLFSVFKNVLKLGLFFEYIIHLMYGPEGNS